MDIREDTEDSELKLKMKMAEPERGGGGAAGEEIEFAKSQFEESSST